MSAIVPDVAKIPFQKLWTRESNDLPIACKLFKNDFTPDSDTVLGDLTEADFSGYTAGGQNLANPATEVALDASNRAVTLWDQLTWTKNGATGNTVFGYYWVDNAGNLLLVERFITGGYAMTADGTPLTFFPILTLASQFLN